MSKSVYRKETVEIDDYVITLAYPKFTPATRDQPAEGGIGEGWITSIWCYEYGESLTSYSDEELAVIFKKAIENCGNYIF